jgi:hypothetical protein
MFLSVPCDLCTTNVQFLEILASILESTAVSPVSAGHPKTIKRTVAPPSTAALGGHKPFVVEAQRTLRDAI